MIGRQKEIEILEKALASPKPELVAVIGRRRVGKTYLVRTFFKDRIDFEMVGLKDGNVVHIIFSLPLAILLHMGILATNLPAKLVLAR